MCGWSGVQSINRCSFPGQNLVIHWSRHLGKSHIAGFNSSSYIMMINWKPYHTWSLCLVVCPWVQWGLDRWPLWTLKYSGKCFTCANVCSLTTVLVYFHSHTLGLYKLWCNHRNLCSLVVSCALGPKLMACSSKHLHSLLTPHGRVFFDFPRVENYPISMPSRSEVKSVLSVSFCHSCHHKNAPFREFWVLLWAACSMETLSPLPVDVGYWPWWL